MKAKIKSERGKPAKVLQRANLLVFDTRMADSEVIELVPSLLKLLVILSTHGRTGLKHVLLGSVAESVVRHAPCPVLIVRVREREFVNLEPGFRIVKQRRQYDGNR